MKVTLRIIAVLIGVAVFYTAWWALWFWSSGRLTALLAAGQLGAVTFGGWLGMLVIGPYSAVQLWRLRPSGWWSGTALVAFATAYYFIGAVIFRSPNARIGSILIAGTVNLVLLGVMLMPRARAICRNAA